MDDDDKDLERILGDDTGSDASGNQADGAGSEEQTGAAVTGALIEDVEEAIQYAKKYLEDLLSFFGLNTDVHATTEDGEVIELDIPSTHLNGFLIGAHGDTVRALQYTISNALRSQNYSHTRVNVDVAGYKQQRNERLAHAAEEWFREVKDSGKPKDLQPMNAADRRVVHQAATDYGLETESVGFGRDRHIVLKPGTAVKEDTPPSSKE
jgi:spoIIIJ-associated protein